MILATTVFQILAA